MATHLPGSGVIPEGGPERFVPAVPLLYSRLSAMAVVSIAVGITIGISIAIGISVPIGIGVPVGIGVQIGIRIRIDVGIVVDILIGDVVCIRVVDVVDVAGAIVRRQRLPPCQQKNKSRGQCHE